MKYKNLILSLIEGNYAVSRLSNKEAIPEWAKESQIFSITKTLEELSIVCSENCVPDGVKCEKNWKILKVEGPLDFSLIGILASISSVLANKSISIFAISTYDTDYILVKNKGIEDAIDALTEEGYSVNY